MLTLPIVMACILAVVAAYLLCRPATRWLGLLLLSGLSGWLALICAAGVVLTQDGSAGGTATSRALDIAGGLFALLTLAFLVPGLISARASWRGRRLRP